MPRSPEPTTINSVLEDYDRTFPMDWPPGLGSDRQADRVAFKAFLRQAISKTCDEILGVLEVRKAPCGKVIDDGDRDFDGCANCYGGTQLQLKDAPEQHYHYENNWDDIGWNKARETVESKVKEICGTRTDTV